jgi:hypothetical protein
MDEKKSQLVQMRLRKPTIKQVGRLQKILKSETRTDVVKVSLDLAEMVASAMKEGSSLILESKSGKRERIVIPGI